MAFHAAPSSNPASPASISSIGSSCDLVDVSLAQSLEMASLVEMAAARLRVSAVMGPEDNRSSEIETNSVFKSVRFNSRLQSVLWTLSNNPSDIHDVEQCIAQFTLEQVAISKRHSFDHVNSAIQTEHPDSDLIKLCEYITHYLGKGSVAILT